MKSLLLLIKEYRLTLIFLGKFIGLYFLLNTIYGLYIESFSPGSDPFTNLVSTHAGWILMLFHDNITTEGTLLSKYVAVSMDGQVIVNVFEGCNSLNVLIVFFVFVIAFSSTWYRHWKFLALSTFIIYLINLFRVATLFWVSLYFPSSLYFFHKFFLTGIIYGVVFVLWYFWVKKMNNVESRAATS
jgi:exosortase family protein XrtF